MQPINDSLAPDWLPPSALKAVFEAVVEAYPEEACGIFLGPAHVGAGVTRVVRCQNVFAGNRCHGYAFDPFEHLELLRQARALHETQLAIFHSHPDGEARLSTEDLSGIWFAGTPMFPKVLYCVVSTVGTRPQRLTAFAPTQAGSVAQRGEWRFEE